VTALQRVHITKTGTFKGDIEAPSIEIDLGGVLDGFVRIGAKAPT
jgi:cytoskeletal protein CcmA (bactofilin family)